MASVAVSSALSTASKILRNPFTILFILIIAFSCIVVLSEAGSGISVIAEYVPDGGSVASRAVSLPTSGGQGFYKLYIYTSPRLPGVAFNVSNTSYQTDADGKITVSLPPGNYSVTVIDQTVSAYTFKQWRYREKVKVGPTMFDYQEKTSTSPTIVVEVEDLWRYSWGDFHIDLSPIRDAVTWFKANIYTVITVLVCIFAVSYLIGRRRS